MKQFIVNRHTTPSTPTLEEVPNEKIRVFANETAMDAALSSLDENEIVATEDGAESSTRIGNPLGTVLSIHSNAVPYGYLPCNGVAFDEHQYPALYALLGDNHTPYSYDKSRLGDYETFTLTTSNQEMPYDGVIIIQSSNNYTIPAQTVYVNDVSVAVLNFDYGNGGSVSAISTIAFRKGDKIKISNTTNISAKVAYYTHFNVIKATSGLEETQQDYVLQSLLEADNYSTDEVATGKKWIDGKMIYRKCFYSATNWSSGIIGNVGSAIDTVIKVYCTAQYNTGHWFTNYDTSDVNSPEVAPNGDVYVNRGGGFINNLQALVVVEYTKAN